MIDCGDDSPGGRLGSHPEAGPEAGQEGAFSGSVNSRAGGDGDDNDNESEGESESGQNSGGDASFGDASDDAELHQTGDIAAAVLNCSAGDIEDDSSAAEDHPEGESDANNCAQDHEHEVEQGIEQEYDCEYDCSFEFAQEMIPSPNPQMWRSKFGQFAVPPFARRRPSWPI